MLNKTLTTFYILIIIVSCSNILHAQNDPVMQYMSESVYSPIKDGSQIREIALTQFIASRSYYNEDGYRIEFQQFNGKDELHDRTSYTVEDDGQVSQSVTTSNQGIVEKYTVSEFDTNNQIISIKTYDNTDKLLIDQINTYDAQGNRISKAITNVPASVTRLTEYIYNADNELITETEYEIDSTIKQIRNFQYDNLGNEIESDLTRANGEFTRFVTTYDTNNNMLNQKWYDVDNNLINEDSYEYIYDVNDNWTTSKRYTEGEMMEVDERQISYH